MSLLLTLLLLWNPPPFERITIADGLSQNMVNHVIQDQRGFIWFATKDGLNRFDGYGFRVYRNMPGDSSTLSGNYVTGIWEDARGIMWIVTNGGGLNRFDPITEVFTRIPARTEDGALLDMEFASQIVGKDSTILISTRNEGLVEYHIHQNRFSKVRMDDSGRDVHVSGMAISSRGDIWGNSTTEVFVLDRTRSRVVRYPLIGRDQQPTNLYLLNDSVAVAPTRTGINRFELRNGTLNLVRTAVTGISLGYSSMLVPIPGSDELWMTSMEGLYRYNPGTDRLAREFPIDTRPTTALLMDTSGILWIGTAGWGIIKYNPALQHFNTGEGNLLAWVYPDLLARVGAVDQVDLDERGAEFHAVHVASDGALWMANIGFKLYRFDRNTGVLASLPVGRGLTRKALNRRFNRIAEDPKGSIWLATAGGVYRYDEPRGRLEYHAIYPGAEVDAEYYNPTGGPDITAMHFDRNGVLWLGTPDRGIARYQPEDRALTWIRHSVHDANTLSSNHVLDISADPHQPDAFLWVGTDGGGLNRLSMQDHSSRRYYITDGLPNMVVYGIMADDTGQLWMSTNNGLSRFNPATGTFRNFTWSDGLHSNEFNRNEFLKRPDGTLYFGGLNGHTWFHPAAIRENGHIPRIRITDFLLYNKPVDLSMWEMLRREDGTALELDHAQNMFTIEFAALEYTASDRNRYRYKMEGFDQDWIESGYNRTATYTNLSPGAYTFRVLASNNDGVWNEVGLAVPVVIHPPFWMTTWFRTLAVLAALGITGFLYRRRIGQMEAEKRRLEEISRLLIEREEEERQRIAREMHDSLGQELLVMKQWVGKWGKTRPDDPHRSNYEELSGHISGILKSVRDITHNLRPPELDRIGVTETVRYMLEEGCASSGITTEIEFDEIDAHVSADHAIHILRIFQELLTNAIRHGKAGHIHTSMSLGDEAITIRFKDDGVGFDPQRPDARAGLGLSGISERIRFLQGTFTVHTAPGQGVEVVMSFPKQSSI